MHTIPPALKDRMEVLRLPGYTLHEKIEIAQRHLLPKLLKSHGLHKIEIVFEKDGIREVIERFTKEAGVRNLERELASICRKLARKVVGGEEVGPVAMTPAKVVELLGVPRYHLPNEKETLDEIGVATGLAWTDVGGETLSIEATLMRGRGKLTLTGQLGDVMQESAQAAMSYIRSRAEELGIDPLFYRKHDIHVHLPEGAIPKDGPSAGIALATAITSLLSNNPVKARVAMTGELTLRGRVLPIGGVKEKVLAAYRFGAKIVILPRDNEKDLSEIPDDILKKLDFRLVSHMDEVLTTALADPVSTLGIEGGETKDQLDDADTGESMTH
jgi:ATP-dependent Lon protease